LLEESYNVYNNNYGHDNVLAAGSFIRLANLYNNIGEYTKAKKLSEEALILYKKNYGENHINTALVLNSLGAAHLLMNDLANAESLFNQALAIFQKNKHPNSFISLEKLSELYIKRSIEEKNKGNIDEGMRNLKKQAISYLKQALVILQTFMPKDSPHIARIKLKIQNIAI
jgi:tetratricopeptide (TPR) repeat protein